MTNIQILDNDFEAIQKYIAFGREKFNLTINVEKNINAPMQRKHKSLSIMLDRQIRNAKNVNTAKATKIKTAMEELNTLLDTDKMNLSVSEAREKYFTSKTNQI